MPSPPTTRPTAAAALTALALALSGFLPAPAAAAPAWLTTDTPSAAGENASQPHVAVDQRGNVTAVWRRWDGLQNRVQAAVRPAGGTWQSADTLSDAGQTTANPQVAVDPNGNAVAVWLRNDGVNDRVQAAVRPAGGTWQTPTTLSDAGQTTANPHVAVDANGNGVAIWYRNDGAYDRIQAAVRPAGGTWQTPTTLSDPGHSADEPGVAVDPNGNAVAVWRRSDGSNDRIQAVGYDAAGPLLSALTIPATATTGTPITLSVSALDVWSALGTITWNLGDDTTATGASATHTYTAAGARTVTVTATDALGNATTQTRQVIVTAPASTPAPTTTTTTPRPSTTRRCQSRRALRVRLRARATRVQIRISRGKRTIRTRTLTRPTRTATVNLKGLTAGTYRVRITAKTKRRTITITRTWKTCQTR